MGKNKKVKHFLEIRNTGTTLKDWNPVHLGGPSCGQAPIYEIIKVSGKPFVLIGKERKRFLSEEEFVTEMDLECLGPQGVEVIRF